MIVLFAFIFPITGPIKHLTLLSAFAIAIGLSLLCRGLVVLCRKRPRQAQGSKVAEALAGLVQLHGVATGPNTISAPITGKPCYLYRTTVWQQQKNANHEWEKVADETLHVPFLLDDSTGQLLIEPLGADLDLQSDFQKEYDPSLFIEERKAPPSVSQFLARHGVTPVRRIRVEERSIGPESAVFIAGTVMENPGIELRPLPRTSEAARQPRQDAPEVIRLSVSTEPRTVDAMTQQAKIAAALVKAGIQNPDAWTAAGVAYPDSASASDRGMREAGTRSRNGQNAPQLSSEPHVPHGLVLMKGPEGTPFLISWRQWKLGRVPFLPSGLMLCVGTTLILAGLYALLLKMRLL